MATTKITRLQEGALLGNGSKDVVFPVTTGNAVSVKVEGYPNFPKTVNKGFLQVNLDLDKKIGFLYAKVEPVLNEEGETVDHVFLYGFKSNYEHTLWLQNKGSYISRVDMGKLCECVQGEEPETPPEPPIIDETPVLILPLNYADDPNVYNEDNPIPVKGQHLKKPIKLTSQNPKINLQWIKNGQAGHWQEVVLDATTVINSVNSENGVFIYPQEATAGYEELEGTVTVESYDEGIAPREVKVKVGKIIRLDVQDIDGVFSYGRTPNIGLNYKMETARFKVQGVNITGDTKIELLNNCGLFTYYNQDGGEILKNNTLSVVVPETEINKNGVFVYVTCRKYNGSVTEVPRQAVRSILRISNEQHNITKDLDITYDPTMPTIDWNSNTYVFPDNPQSVEVPSILVGGIDLNTMEYAEPSNTEISIEGFWEEDKSNIDAGAAVAQFVFHQKNINVDKSIFITGMQYSWIPKSLVSKIEEEWYYYDGTIDSLTQQISASSAPSIYKYCRKYNPSGISPANLTHDTFLILMRIKLTPASTSSISAILSAATLTGQFGTYTISHGQKTEAKINVHIGPDNPGGGNTGGGDDPHTPDIVEISAFEDAALDENIIAVLREITDMPYAEDSWLRNNIPMIQTLPAHFMNGVNKNSSGYYFFENAGDVVRLTNLGTIGEYAFANCEYLAEVAIPYTVETIGAHAFENDTTLNSVTFEDTEEHPSRLKIIGIQAFTNCTSLTEVTLPQNLTTIEYGAFRNSGLTSIVIPNSVTNVYSVAFNECPNLEIVDFGEGVSYLADSVLSDSPAITDVYLRSPVCVTLAIPRGGAASNPLPVNDHLVTIHVPEDLISSYEASRWASLSETNIEFVAIEEETPEETSEPEV